MADEDAFVCLTASDAFKYLSSCYRDVLRGGGAGACAVVKPSLELEALPVCANRSPSQSFKTYHTGYQLQHLNDSPF